MTDLDRLVLVAVVTSAASAVMALILVVFVS